MANLNDRAQMLLVGGLAVAVSIVVLVALLNAAIYTQNVATRSGNAEGEAALQYRAVATDGVADLLDAENERPYTSHGPLRSNVTGGAENISDTLRGQRVSSLAEARLDVVALHNGTRVVQDVTRNLTSAENAANWTVAQDADGVRSFVVTPTNVEGELLTLDPTNDSTRIVVEGAGGKEWRLHLYNTSSGDEYLYVRNGSGSTTDRPCGGIDTGEPIDLTAGTVNGTSCPALSFANGTAGPWDVSIAYGNHTEGRYDLTVNTTSINGLEPAGSTDSPREEPVLYSAKINVTYRTPELEYAAGVRVTPGEDGA